MHGGEQTHGAQAVAIDGLCRCGRSVGLGRIHHEEPDEALRMTSDGSGDRSGVARDAGHQRRA